jgi:CysZ protein
VKARGIAGFLLGFGALFAGLGLLFRARGLGAYLLLSLGANLLAVALLAAGGWFAWDAWGAPALAAHLPEWLLWATHLLTLLLLLTAAFLLFPLLIPVVAAPFLDPLAAKIESHLLGRPAPDETGGFLRAALQDIWTGFKLLLWGLSYALLCLLLAPFALGLLLALALGSWIAALSWLDYPLARRGLSWRAKRAWVREHLAPSLGFGLAVSLSFLLPLYNLLLAAPAAAAGAGWLYIRLSDNSPRG